MPNPDQQDFHADGQGDACQNDTDGDDRPDDVDHCPEVANADQGDADRDGAGDACDGDDDADDIPDDQELADVCTKLKNL